MQLAIGPMQASFKIQTQLAQDTVNHLIFGVTQFPVILVKVLFTVNDLECLFATVYSPAT
jgi:hypothetical protein